MPLTNYPATIPTDDLLKQSPPLEPELKAILQKTANTIRGLAMDAVQKAESGHPGLPMGCAEIGAYLYGYALRHNPKNPDWPDRDRFILSAGHGSMLLYSCLHLAGYDLSLEDIKQFRQWDSKTPGHPESHMTPGVETTTGPLGQGLGNAVGQALGLKLLGAQFNSNAATLFDSKIFCLMGDGCMMEGVTSEVSSLAGHLNLNNLILIYDANKISLDGPLHESASEETKLRYAAYGWEVYDIDGHDLDQLHAVISALRVEQKRPALILAHTIIGKGSPHKAGTSHAHGAPLGVQEVAESKKALGIPQDAFYVPSEVYDYFKRKLVQDKELEAKWNKVFEGWAKGNPDKMKQFETMRHHTLPSDLEERLNNIQMPAAVAGRKASQSVIEVLGTFMPQLYGGSADLSGSDLTMMKVFPIVTAEHFEGRNIKYGVREFGMACMATGLAETGMITPFIGTFLTFSDYMRNAIRLCSLMRHKVIYQFTHDSIFLGEDGPTHQPVEHYASLRTIPHLQVIRPADAHEVVGAWIAALRYDGPTALLLSRQNLPTLVETKVAFANGVGRGAYIVHKEHGGKPNYTLFATGSELWLALDVAKELEKVGKKVRVISMPCWEIFDLQAPEYKQEIMGGDIGKRVSIEAGVEQGWHKYIGLDGIAIAQNDFGASAPYSALQEHFGFTKEKILARIL
ncbi:MAG: transketolase [Parachlamydiales bacterium]|jgi:transketolase